MTQYQFWKSGVFWSFVAAFLIGGFQNISGMLPAGWATVILGIVGILGTMSHVKLANSLGARN